MFCVVILIYLPLARYLWRFFTKINGSKKQRNITLMDRYGCRQVENLALDWHDKVSVKEKKKKSNGDSEALNQKLFTISGQCPPREIQDKEEKKTKTSINYETSLIKFSPLWNKTFSDFSWGVQTMADQSLYSPSNPHFFQPLLPSFRTHLVLCSFLLFSYLNAYYFFKMVWCNFVCMLLADHSCSFLPEASWRK